MEVLDLALKGQGAAVGYLHTSGNDDIEVPIWLSVLRFFGRRWC